MLLLERRVCLSGMKQSVACPRAGSTSDSWQRHHQLRLSDWTRYTGMVRAGIPIDCDVC